MATATDNAAAPPATRPRQGRHDSHQTRIRRPAPALAEHGPHRGRGHRGRGAGGRRGGQAGRGDRIIRGCWVICNGSGSRPPSCSKLASMAAFAIMLAPAARGGRRQRRVSGRCWPPPTRPTHCRSRCRWPAPSWPPPSPSGVSPGRVPMPRWPAGRCWPAAWSPPPPATLVLAAAVWRPGTSSPQRSPFPAAPLAVARSVRGGSGHAPAAVARRTRTASRLGAAARVPAIAPARRRTPPDRPGLG